MGGRTMKRQHTYLGVTYETDNTGDIYHVLLGGLPVTGTVSQSRGEASMRFMLMIEAMQDYESKPMQVGDLIEYDDKQVGVVDFIDDVEISIRAMMGGDGTNFRGPQTAMSEDQTPRVSLSGGPFVTRRRVTYEWLGVSELEFWAWRALPEADGGFKYQREVNVWKECKQ